jgi:hypothetical protein
MPAKSREDFELRKGVSAQLGDSATNPQRVGPSSGFQPHLKPEHHRNTVPRSEHLLYMYVLIYVYIYIYVYRHIIYIYINVHVEKIQQSDNCHFKN